MIITMMMMMMMMMMMIIIIDCMFGKVGFSHSKVAWFHQSTFSDGWQWPLDPLGGTLYVVSMIFLLPRSTRLVV